MNNDTETLCPYCEEELPIPSDIEAGDHNYIEPCDLCSGEVEYIFSSNGEEIFNCQIQCSE